jgi:hypothetical protein
MMTKDLWVVVCGYGTPSARPVTPIWEDKQYAENAADRYGGPPKYSVHRFDWVIDIELSSGAKPYPLKDTAFSRAKG